MNSEYGTHTKWHDPKPLSIRDSHLWHAANEVSTWLTGRVNELSRAARMICNGEEAAALRKQAEDYDQLCSMLEDAMDRDAERENL